ncbi:hypothetical protein R5R35_001262 [Gryllus longicercus]|uniref:Lipid droplet-regulating VLDL assembly factor AUP1 n=1 Tax=Gryllus longicercus TaxID=2509291 RepID=A0AAN9Z7L5_9ORTH
MSTVELKTLFYESRYPSGWATVCLLLYAPIGLILVVLRTFIALQALVAAAVLPELSSVRRFVLRSMCVVLGIVVKEENVSQRNENARVIVSNHVSPCDHLAVHVLSSCVTPCTWGQPAPIFRVIGVKDFNLSQGVDAVVTKINHHLEQYSTPVLVLPEGSTTSGKTGLLKFAVWPFRIRRSVQPVLLKVWRPYVTQVAPTALVSSFWADIFWFLFSPSTVFTVRYLPVAEQEEEETDLQFSVRVQQMMADALGVVATKYTSGDKAEYEKRYILELNRPVPSYSSNSELQRMARQVRDVLPHVPYDVVVRDLSRTRSIDVTITNILEGHISFTPLPEPQHEPVHVLGTQTTDENSVSFVAPTTSTQGTSFLDTSAPSFPRSAQERMLSFNERKARLIENARQKYIEKHGLKLVGFNC